jgi:large subunit ribosomal protein L18
MTVLREVKKRYMARLTRHRRVRKKITGTEERPRLAVFRSAKHIYCQLIDDTKEKVLCAASTLSKEYPKEGYSGNVASAGRVGSLIGKRALEQGVTTVVFDNGGFRYHGRIKALANAAREAGLIF